MDQNIINRFESAVINEGNEENQQCLCSPSSWCMKMLIRNCLHFLSSLQVLKYWYH